MERCSLIAALGLLAATLASPAFAEPRRLERGRAVVDFDSAELSAAEAAAFAELADRGVAHVELLAGPGIPERARHHGRVRFVVSGSVPISRTRSRVVFLPLERVRRHQAPYLHETVHALVPARGDRTWLCEGLACYLESRVSETLGGYDAHVFTRAGTNGIHAAARRTLASAAGQAVLPWLGGCGDPPGLEADRAGVARPFYVLAHSLTKHVVDTVGLAAVVRALGTGGEDALARTTGLAGHAWRDAWLAALGQAPLRSPSIDQRIPVTIGSCG